MFRHFGRIFGKLVIQSAESRSVTSFLPLGIRYRILELALPVSLCIGLVLNQLRDLKYKVVSWPLRRTCLRSIKPSRAISLKVCLILAGDHIFSCFQSNRPDTAFSSPIGMSLANSSEIDM